MGKKPHSQRVGEAFVQQYYHHVRNSPGILHLFYKDESKLGRPEEDGSMSVTTTIKEIKAKIASLVSFADLTTEIESVDAHDSFNDGVDVLVTGYLVGKDDAVRNFVQSFFLAPQERGYFVLNDMFRFVGKAFVNPNPFDEALAAEPKAVSTDVIHDDLLRKVQDAVATLRRRLLQDDDDWVLVHVENSG